MTECTTKEDKFLISAMRERMQRSSKNYMITWSNFLDLRQRALVSDALSHITSYKEWHITPDPDVRIDFYGGYPEAERTITVFLPSYISDNALTYFKNNPDDPLILLRAALPKGSPSITHRDYLGALMGLGIKREMTGDIITYDNGADIIVFREIADFIQMNMVNAGRASISLQSLPLCELHSPEMKFKEMRVSISSLRLDNILSATFGLSRTKAHKAISSGIVYVNDICMEKPDKQLTSGCKLVLRKHGKAVFRSIEGTSSKGRTIIKIEKYF